jgi:hypothetical protein
MLAWLFDPRVFNYVMITLCLLSSARWALFGNVSAAIYWLSAGTGTAAVTWGISK